MPVSQGAGIASPRDRHIDRAKQYRNLHNLILEICDIDMNLRISLSSRTLWDVVVHASKDMDKLREHQFDSISLTKRIAGLSFWIRRLKPISVAFPKDTMQPDQEIQDINEQVAIRLATRLLIQTADHGNHGQLMRGCDIEYKCDKLKDYFVSYWSFDNYYNYANMLYSLRYRNFSPHHLALIFDSILAGFALKHASNAI